MMEDQKLKDYMFIEIPVYIDWNKFGEKTEVEKQIILKKMAFDLIDKPLINQIDDNTERTEGIILKAEVVDNDKISAFGLMWVEAEPELETYISSRTAETNLRPTGVRMKYAHELNETFQKITEKKNSIKKDLLTKMSLLDERIQ